MNEERLFSMMLDKKPAADAKLPDTGIGYEKEKQLSSRFILMDGYGTRNTTLIKVNNMGQATIKERVFDQIGEMQDEQEIDFFIKP